MPCMIPVIHAEITEEPKIVLLKVGVLLLFKKHVLGEQSIC